MPSRRTRDADEVDVSWQIDAYQFELPVIAAAMDGVTSPTTAIEMGRLGGVGCAAPRGPVVPPRGSRAAARGAVASIDDDEALAPPARAARRADGARAHRRARPADPRRRRRRSCVAVTPQRTEELLPHIIDAEPDLLRDPGHGHLRRARRDGAHPPLDLKHLVRRLEVPVLVGGCASYQAALHLMRTGAAGVLVGVGPGVTSTTSRVLGVGNPQATAIADARAARMRHLDETGVYVHVIADGGMRPAATSPRRSCAAPTASCSARPSPAANEAPAGGCAWSHGELPPHAAHVGACVVSPRSARCEQILVGPVGPTSTAAPT